MGPWISYLILSLNILIHKKVHSKFLMHFVDKPAALQFHLSLKTEDHWGGHCKFPAPQISHCFETLMDAFDTDKLHKHLPQFLYPTVSSIMNST